MVLTLGAVTMIIGAWRALRQYDIKLLLAYGTVSQLGFLMAMCGLGTRSAMLAGVAMIISHALFKAALFLVVGIVDRSTGTRDIRKLSGVAQATAAGRRSRPRSRPRRWRRCPPLIGFTAKEAAFESLVYLLPDGDQTGIPPLPAFLLMGALVAGLRPHRRLHPALPVGGVRHQAERAGADGGHPRARRLRCSPR